MRTCRISFGELPYILKLQKKKIQGIHLSMETITSYVVVIVGFLGIRFSHVHYSFNIISATNYIAMKILNV